jgi:hypothetical protein
MATRWLRQARCRPPAVAKPIDRYGRTAARTREEACHPSVIQDLRQHDRDRHGGHRRRNSSPRRRPVGPATLSEQTRLADRRFVTTGDHFHEVGAADATYPATGWHIRGEMSRFWTPPIKLLDGLWFGVDGR